MTEPPEVPGSSLLHRYEREWGEASDRVQRFAKLGEHGFAVLTFEAVGPVVRFVTLGLFRCVASDGGLVGSELMLVVDRDRLSDATADAARSFLADVAATMVKHSFRPTEGSLIDAAPSIPWDFEGVLFDTPRGEPEEMEVLDIGGVQVPLFWVVPLYDAEVGLIRSDGVAAFDALLDDDPDASLTDPGRPRLVTANRREEDG